MSATDSLNKDRDEMVGSKVPPRHDTLAFWTGVTELFRALQEPCTWPAYETGGGNPILGTFPKSPSSPGTDPQPRYQSTCNYKEHHRGARIIPRCWGCWLVFTAPFPPGLPQRNEFQMHRKGRGQAGRHGRKSTRRKEKIQRFYT